VSSGPSTSLPLMVMVVDGTPLGFQLMGFARRDTQAAGIARWMLAAFS
jgi:Asp-tRNA(Asn)/Glu-tRNA(Gln) amidotransferase A subunit family amidase